LKKTLKNSRKELPDVINLCPEYREKLGILFLFGFGE